MAWIESNGVVLRYHKSGSSQRTVVLIHEMGGTLESWDAVAGLLEDRYTVLRFDLRCSGLSEFRPGALSVSDLSADLLGLLETLGIADPCAVAGCAVGAAVAIHFAASFPDRVAALVAMAPSVGLPPGRRSAALARAAQLEREGARAGIDEQLARTNPPELCSDPGRFAELRRRRLAANPFASAALGRMLAELDLEMELARIACPVLVLAGRYDRVRPPDGVAETAARIRGSEFGIIETGHFMPLQTPVPVAAAMTDFFQRRWG